MREIEPFYALELVIEKPAIILLGNIMVKLIEGIGLSSDRKHGAFSFTLLQGQITPYNLYPEIPLGV